MAEAEMEMNGAVQPDGVPEGIYTLMNKETRLLLNLDCGMLPLNPKPGSELVYQGVRIIIRNAKDGVVVTMVTSLEDSGTFTKTTPMRCTPFVTWRAALIWIYIKGEVSSHHRRYLTFSNLVGPSCKDNGTHVVGYAHSDDEVERAGNFQWNTKANAEGYYTYGSISSVSYSGML